LTLELRTLVAQRIVQGKQVWLCSELTEDLVGKFFQSPSFYFWIHPFFPSCRNFQLLLLHTQAGDIKTRDAYNGISYGFESKIQSFFEYLD